MYQMLEVKYILSSTTEKSLVIIDELGRSTSAEEGTAIAMAIVEQIGLSSTYLYVTTHFIAMTKLYNLYPNVKVWQLETIASDSPSATLKLDFKHHLKTGVTTVRRYGVYIVQSNWSGSILKYINEVLQKMTNKQDSRLSKLVSLEEKSRLKYTLEAQFKRLKSDHKLTICQINKLLEQYQNDLLSLGYSINVQLLSDDQILINNQGENTYFLQSCPQLSNEMEAQLAENRMNEMFTPDSAIQNRSQTLMRYNNNKDDTLERISEFIAEHSDNVNKLVPEIKIEEGDTFYQMPEEAYGFQTPIRYLSSQNDENFGRPQMTGTPDFSELWMKDLEQKNLNASMTQVSEVSESTAWVKNSEHTTCQMAFASILSDDNSSVIREDPCQPPFNLCYKNENRLGTSINRSSRSTPWINSKENILSQRALTVHSPEEGSWIANPEQFLSPILPVPEQKNIISDICDLNFQNSIDNMKPNLARPPNVFNSSWSQNRNQEEIFRSPDTPDWLKDKNCPHSSTSPIVNIRPEPLDISAVSVLRRSPSLVNHCPNYQFYNRDNSNINIRILSQSKDIDMESVKEELEIYSRILTDDENEDDYWETATVTTKFQELDLELIKEKQPTERPVQPHIFPIVTIIEGPNDTTLSFGEEDDKERANNKIKILSDIKLVAGNSPKDIYPKTIVTVPSENSSNKESGGLDMKNAELNDSKVTTSYYTPDSSPRKDIKHRQNTIVDRTFGSKIPSPKESSSLQKKKITTDISDAPNLEFCSVATIASGTFKDYEKITRNTEEDRAVRITTPSSKKSSSPTKEKTTSTSEASKLRNLDQASSISSSQNQESSNKSFSAITNQSSSFKNDENLKAFSTSKEKTTSISEASKLRNLDQANSSSSPQGECSSKKVSSSQTSVSSASRKRNFDQASSNSFDTSLQEASTSTKPSTSVSARVNNKFKCVKRKFVPPRKMSAKEIRQDFDEQDKRMLENLDSSNMSAYYKQLLNRPSIKQLQNVQHLALFRRTSDGFQEMPLEPQQKKARKLSSYPIKKQASIDLTIFSDKNARSFEAFLNSNQDIKTFNSNIQRTHEVDAKMFDFKPTEVKIGEYTDNSITKNFIRKSDEDFEGGDIASPFTNKYFANQQNNKSNFSQFSLTPDGFFKRNKEDITNIMNKYLNNSRLPVKNIFETNNLSNEDLSL